MRAGQQNTMDHDSARLAAMFWREQALMLAAELRRLQEIASTPDQVKDGSALAFVRDMLGAA